MSEPGAIATGFSGESGTAADDSLEQNGKPKAFRTSSGKATTEPDNPFGIPGLKHKLDDYGKDIWVEEEDHRGKHIRWYSLDSNGEKVLSVRDSWGVTRKRIE